MPQTPSLPAVIETEPRTSVTVAGVELPALFAPNAKTAKRTLEFFAANIRNAHTRAAYARAVSEFSAWCDRNGLHELQDIEPLHVAAYIEDLLKRRDWAKEKLSAPSVKQQLAGLRMLFDWLVVGQVIATNPASAVRGPKYSIKKGKTRVLSAAETRTLLDSVDTSTVMGLRDRALIALMVYTFARVGAAAERMRVKDVFMEKNRLYVTLHEKNGKLHVMPCHHSLEKYLLEYIERAGLSLEPETFLFRGIIGKTDQLSDQPLDQSNVWRMVRRRAEAAGIKTAIGCHSFRATGITEYLRNGGLLEKAQKMANHESARTTGLYDRREDEVTLDEVERILI